MDLAERIAARRGEKPMTAVANESAFSAAYAIASAADEIVVPRTAGVGSIGVIATHVDRSGENEMQGRVVTHVYAGARKADLSPHRPLSEEALSWLQATIESHYEIFVALVAANRGISEQAVRQTEAGVFFGPDAVTAGLADRVGPAVEVIESQQGGRSMSTSETPQLDEQALEQARNEGYEAGRREAVEQAVSAERKRCQEVLAVATTAGRAEQASALIEEGLSVDSARSRLFDLLAGEQQSIDNQLAPTDAGRQAAGSWEQAFEIR
nr:S49 family peptidase [Halorhodospira sp. 9622]